MAQLACFNTQPPEGGWTLMAGLARLPRFQHTAARRRLESKMLLKEGEKLVSTHSRPKAADQQKHGEPRQRLVSTHSRPKAAVNKPFQPVRPQSVSTHSRPKAADGVRLDFYQNGEVSTHSRPKAAG